MNLRTLSLLVRYYPAVNGLKLSDGRYGAAILARCKADSDRQALLLASALALHAHAGKLAGKVSREA